MRLVAIGSLFLIHESYSFLPGCPYLSSCGKNPLRIPQQTGGNQQAGKEISRSTSSTSLRLLLDVPDGFFTVTFATLGLLLSISKNFARIRMEERAWEQRLEEARAERLRRDPTLTEIDLRRKEASLEWSAYGKPRIEQEKIDLEVRQRSGQRVAILERDEDDEDVRKYRMTDSEIESFEMEYGIVYDPYYDDPYEEDELPEGKYTVDRLYGDRVYEDGEIFYRDARSGLYYRQGCKPRNLRFWS